ncbi:uncharacterized protein LOC128996007 [Macrosteles quadrilineatus]|uniref:uncharacterized protein LOC128996007 n=1 Tax=Macrosteles quadrilineatus TaxID=74068 RepID=UPI0023E15004|nr:uncharacterized protein LOC128996007 [Macrosteles quadrilineatus]
MSDQYVFELCYKRQGRSPDEKETQFVIIDGSSMADFCRLREDLGMCMAEPFTVQYIDDENDVISIDTEEEFQEFAKIAKKRCSRGMLMRLILNSNTQAPTPPEGRKKVQFSNSQRHANRESSAKTPKTVSEKPIRDPQDMLKFKQQFIAEVKREILSELRGAEGAQAGSSNINTYVFKASGSRDSSRMEVDSKETEYEEDSDFLCPPEKNSRKTKLMHHSQKKLEKKDKLIESKIDQRLEKLEMKRKKLMDKVNQKMTPSKFLGYQMSQPMIFSAIATQETTKIDQPVTASEMFSHTWTIVNDGTVSLNNVALRHTYSSPGLEPKDLVLKLTPLQPNETCNIVAKFRAPKTRGITFISYWHLFRLVDAQWQEFGHYVSVTGTTESSVGDTASNDLTVTNQKPLEENPIDMVGIVEEETNVRLKQQMEQLQATLASTEIAAEMAQKAARLLARAAESNKGKPQSGASTTTTPSTSAPQPERNCQIPAINRAELLASLTHAQNRQRTESRTNARQCAVPVCDRQKLLKRLMTLQADTDLEQAAVKVQQLNLVESESDTDTNMETGEDTDRGFVMVNMTTEQTSPEGTQGELKEDNTAASETVNPEEAQPEPQRTPFVQSQQPHLGFWHQVPLGSDYPRPMYYPLPARPLYNSPVFSEIPPRPANNLGVVFPPPMNYHNTWMPPPGPVPLHPFVPLPQTMTPLASHPLPVTLQPVTQSPATAQTTVTPTEAADITAPENPAATVPTTAEVEQEQQQEPQTDAATPNPEEETQAQTSNPVQILPQSLVDGAINVAATAYSTAWNALNNLRPKEGEAAEFDPVFENNMAVLVEMGFNNLERNARLLKRFNNDISQVIGVICSTGGGHDLNID